MKKTFLFFLFVILSSTSFAAMFNNCTPFTAHNGKKFCMVHMPMNLFSAMAYCHQQGFKLASVSDLCDIDSDPANRFTRIWGVAACKNIAGDDVIQTAAKKWLSSPAGEKSMCAVMDYNSPHDATVVDIGSPESIKTTYGAICDTGEWDCPPGTRFDPTTQRCLNLFCSYNYTAAETGNPESDCEYNYAIIDGVATLSSRGSKSECPANYFCALKWQDATCSSDMNSSSSIIYGVCSPKDELYVMCKQTRIPATVTVNEGKGCPDNQFCYLAWQNQTCGGIPSNFSGPMLYGVCVDKDTSTAPACPLTPS